MKRTREKCLFLHVIPYEAAIIVRVGGRVTGVRIL